jgi:hypothetical protein
MSGDSFNVKVRFYLKFRLVFMSKGWAKGLGIEDKDVVERKNTCICVCKHKKEKRERE